MKKVFFIITIIFLLFNKAYSANPDKGEATTYNVTMQKVELCKDSACMLGIYEPLYLSQPHELPISTTRYALSRSVPLSTLWTFTRIQNV